jgi:hypothetical protein
MRCRSIMMAALAVAGLVFADAARAGSGHVPAPQTVIAPAPQYAAPQASAQVLPAPQGDYGCATCTAPVETCGGGCGMNLDLSGMKAKLCGLGSGLKCKMGGLKCKLHGLGSGLKCKMAGIGSCFKMPSCGTPVSECGATYAAPVVTPSYQGPSPQFAPAPVASFQAPSYQN